MTELIALPCIDTGRDLQARAALSREKILEYTQLYVEALEEAQAAMQVEGGDLLETIEWPLPNVVLFYDRERMEYYMGDGFHRYSAVKKAGLEVINAEVKNGTRRDATLYAIGANASHGLPRTHDDRRRAVAMLLDDEEWSFNKSSREIAAMARVSHTLVLNMLHEREGGSGAPDGESDTATTDSAEDNGYGATTQSAEEGAASGEASGEENDEPRSSEELLTDEDWLSIIPVIAHLRKKGISSDLAEADALDYRTLEQRGAIAEWRAHLKRTKIRLGEGGSTPLSRIAIEAAHLPHPRDWFLCSCKGEGCNNCGHAGYQLFHGIPVRL